LTFFRKRQDQGLEDRLRNLSAEPRDDFVSELSGHVRENRLRTTVRSRRFVAALVTSGLMLVPFVAFGGVSYAAAAAKSAVQSVTKSDVKGGGDNNGGNQGGNQGDNQGGGNGGNQGGDSKKPDDDQYKPGKGCGDKNHEHERNNECKSPPKDH
jgi:hypothetical protein